MSDIEAAAKAFHNSLLSQFVRREVFSIAMGSDRLHAYIRCRKNRWPVAIPESFNDVPIVWHWGVGPAIAAQQTSGA